MHSVIVISFSLFQHPITSMAQLILAVWQIVQSAKTYLLW
ncbi:Hypothetical protein EAG7_01993 [Klebsiella aerogenes]|nr:Hypothetical protein EAG7_01993 [Klebsiella aerogenes]CCG30469.1 hypothetical protein [Klebsiella aerogenes EA1509E]